MSLEKKAETKLWKILVGSWSFFFLFFFFYFNTVGSVKKFIQVFHTILWNTQMDLLAYLINAMGIYEI